MSESRFHQTRVIIGGERTSGALRFPAPKLSRSDDSHREEPSVAPAVKQLALLDSGELKFKDLCFRATLLAKAKTLLHVKFGEADMLARGVLASVCV